MARWATIMLAYLAFHYSNATITLQQETSVFKEIGKLHQAITYGHLHLSVNLTNMIARIETLEELEKRVCF